MNNLRTFLLTVENIDGETIGSFTLEGMSKDNDFVDIISYAYRNWLKYQIKPKKHTLEEETFTVSVFKLDTRGRKRLVDSMYVDLEGDSSFEEVVDLAYHGCTDE